ncbi:hypothetical protein [Deinococcus sp.]|uniref:hypothetical protein n=1 Tax=Deinococcus sp. TaxID=47478 RepID=UPI003C7E7368
MRFLIALLLLLAVTLGLTYTFGGIKLGIVTVNPTRMWNVQGESTYSYLNSGNGVLVSGTCTATSGSAILRLTDPDGLQVGGQQCLKGTWTIEMSNKAKFGPYRLTIDYLRYTGTLDLDITR